MLKKILYPLIYGCFLTVFTVYVLLNTFVIEQVYEPITPLPAVTSEETKADPLSPEQPNTEDKEKPIITENSYKDSNIEITLTRYREFDSDLYVAEIKLSSPEYLKTAMARNTFGRNIADETSFIAKENNAIFAVNGDFYGALENGYVLRNGVLYRDSAVEKQEDLVIYKDGSFDIIVETEVEAMELYNNGAQQILSFGPAIIIDCESADSSNITRGSVKKPNPRTAIGIIDELHYIFVVCDGRTEKSRGVTVKEMAEFMLDFGTVTAYNLDGGGSATMYFNGEIINTPTHNGEDIEERNVSDIVYIGY